MTKIPNYRRNFQAGHENQTVEELLTNVYIAAIQQLAHPGEFETLEDLWKEVDYLLELHRLPTKDQ
jgi:hypothetical protein